MSMKDYQTREKTHSGQAAIQSETSHAAHILAEPE